MIKPLSNHKLAHILYAIYKNTIKGLQHADRSLLWQNTALKYNANICFLNCVSLPSLVIKTLWVLKINHSCYAQ